MSTKPDSPLEDATKAVRVSHAAAEEIKARLAEIASCSALIILISCHRP